MGISNHLRFSIWLSISSSVLTLFDAADCVEEEEPPCKNPVDLVVLSMALVRSHAISINDTGDQGWNINKGLIPVDEVKLEEVVLQAWSVVLVC